LKRKRSKGTALSPASISHHVQAIKRYFDGLLLNGELDSHPMAGIHLPKAGSMPREAMPVETVQQLYAHTQKPIETALLGVYYGCGLRRGEGVKLDVMDVHLPMQVLVVREGKFGKRREVPLSPKVASDFAAYIENGRWHAKCGAFLVNAKGKRMDGGTANRMLGQMLLRAGIPERYSLHHLRTSLATHLQANGAGLSQVQEILGHRSFDTTIRYLNTTSCSH
jgi:site-specific recombinase XerD